MSVLAEASTQFGNDILNGIPRSNDGSNHANEQHYQDLRSRARDAQNKGSSLAKQASEAYERGDKAEANQLSGKGKSLRAEADRLNEEAAAWVFRENNTDSAADEIDLHGLFVKEALVALDARLAVCQQHQQPVLKAIVGKGIHSETHIAKLRPAVSEHCNERGFRNEVDSKNPGVVVIHVSGGSVPPANAGYSGAGGYQQQQYQQGQQGQQQQYQQQPEQQQPQDAGLVGILCNVLRQCLR